MEQKVFDEMKHLLSEKAVVKFVKKDGTMRTMFCSKNINFVPDTFKPKGEAKRTNGIAVWDFEKEAWRSFNVESVISVEPWDGKSYEV